VPGKHRLPGWVPYLPPVLAFVLAAVYFLQIRDQAFVEHLVANPLVYDDQAREILAARPPSQPFFLSPLYPAFLAGVYYLSGTSRFVVMICQGVLLAINVWLVGAIAGRLFSRTVALIAAILMTFYWSFYHFAGEMLPTTLCMAFLLAGIFLFLRRDETGTAVVGKAFLLGAIALLCVHAIPFFANIGGLLRGAELPARAGAYYATMAAFLIFVVGVAIVRRRGNLMASGTVLGVSALIWGGTVIVIALLAIRLLLSRTRSYARAALFIAGVLVPVAASLSHNYLISREIIPITSSFGVNLFIGNNAATDGMDPFRFGERDHVRIEADRLALGGAARSAFFRDRALQFVRENPGRWLTLAGRKLLISLGRHEVDNNADISERRSAWKYLFLPVLHFGIIFPLGMAGVFYSARRKNDTRVLALAYAGLVLVSVVFFACERFRLPALALLIPLAAFGAVMLVSDIRRRNVRAVLLSVAIIVGAGLVSNIDFFDVAHTEFPSITVNKSYVERLDGNLDEARRLALAALEAESENAGAFHQLGAIAEGEGDLEAAMTHYLDSLGRDPFFYASYAAARRLLERSRISVSYLDAFVAIVIAGKDYSEARTRLIEFVKRRTQ
jgi:4-amino-4-deoxy-L-arabinose transferase-like glycosyltransferase